MLYSIKKLWWALALLVLGSQPAFGFSLLGPINEPYQQPVIGYGIGGDIGAPKNVGEGYRWNNPVVYYAFDETFVNYFGSNGIAAVDQAIAILNGLTNLSSYSANLSEFPLEAQRINFTAEALSLIDLKSAALDFMVEELGLTEPDRFVWTLRNRATQPGLNCPFMIYEVIKRNLDPVTGTYSTYINGTLYSYTILEFCTGPNPLAITANFPVDPLAPAPTAIASLQVAGFERFGLFYNGLTRDDVGGLRYLLKTNNMNVESVSPDSLEVITNNLTPTLLFTSNLTAFVSQSLTNNTAALQALYPGISVLTETSFFTNIAITNITSFFTNNPTDPVGTPPHVVFVTNTTPGFVQRFIHTFGNVVTNSTFPTSIVTVQTTAPYFPPNQPVGTFYNLTTLATTITNVFNGDIYIVPTNQCGFQILGDILTNVVATTNVITTATGAAGQTFSQAIITYSTNHVFAVDIFQCLPNSVAIREGVDKINFVLSTFDSLLGQFFHPVTNIYTLTAVTNSQTFIQTFQRIVTRPDFLFSAEERNTPVNAELGTGFRSVPIYNQSNIPNNGTIGQGAWGPGTLSTPVTIEFNKVGPLLVNTYIPGFFLNGLSEPQGITNFIWASFDGTTNAPIVYPDGTSIANLQNQVFLQIASTSLPEGVVGQPYTAQLQGLGSQTPFNWQFIPGLPPGLSFSASSVTTVDITGTPTTPGVYDFSVILTDAVGRTSTVAQSIKINP